MTPRRFFYPRVVIEFYNTMTSRREPHHTALHFSINSWPRLLKASDIAATFNLSVVLANSAEYRQWHHPYPRGWSIFIPGTLPLDQLCSVGSYCRICFLLVTFCDLIFSRFSIPFRGEEPSWRPYFASRRATVQFNGAYYDFLVPF